MATLQEQIDATPNGGTLNIAGEHVGNFVINKSITIDGQGVAKILSPNAGPAIDIPSQAARVENVTIKNLEISTVNAAQLIYDIVRIGAWQTTNAAELPHNITLDKVWVHGQPTQDSQRGIAMNGVNVTLSNSRVTDIHGRGMESQGVAAWNTPGPLRFVDNYIEASTENLLIGGADARIPNAVPSDIEIRRNHLFKPLSWHERDPSYAGIDWSIKNLLELKNARRVIIDGNILENCWGDAQIGFAVLLTTRNQDGGNPWATVDDVQFTNNTILNVAGGFQIIGKDWPNVSEQGSRIRIANNIIKLASNLGGNGRLLQLERSKDLSFENNEANPHHTMIVFSGEEQQLGLIYRKNLLTVGEYGVTPASLNPKDAMTRYAPGHDFSANVLMTPTDLSRFYPAGNTFVTSRPDPVPAGLGVDIVALKAAQSGGAAPPLPSPSPTPTPEPPQPTPIVPSPDGTKATIIVDSQLKAWTIGPNKETLRDKVHIDAGTGSIYKYVGATVYVKGTDAAENWYRFTGLGWSFYGPNEPGVIPKPEPDPPPPIPQPVSRSVTWPKQEGKQNPIIDTQWRDRYRLKRVSSGMAEFEKVP